MCWVIFDQSKILDKVIEQASQDDIDLTTINQKQYTAAPVTVKTTSMAVETPETNRPSKGSYLYHHWTHKEININNTRKKLKKILKKYKVKSGDQIIGCKEDLKQTLQAKVQYLRRLESMAYVFDVVNKYKLLIKELWFLIQAKLK